MEHIVKGGKRFVKGKNFRKEFEYLLSLSGKFKTWLISYNESSFTDIDTITSIIKNEGRSVELNDIRLRDRLKQAVDKSQFLLLPKVPLERGFERIQSVMVAPIISEGGCFGVWYIDNAMDHERYSVSDLDYMMLLSIHTATILENF